MLPLLVVPMNAYPFEDPIVTDRPGFSTLTHTVKPGKINVELGYEYSSNNDRGVDQVTQMYPQLELRAGVTANTELSLYWTRLNTSVTNEQSSETTAADLSVGGKYRVHQSPEYNLTMLGWLSFHSGSSPSTSDNIDPILALLWDYYLSSNVFLFGEVQGISYELENESISERIYEAQLTIGSSFSHTDRLSSFIELYGTLPSSDNVAENLVLDGAFLYLLSKDVQIDFDAGVGLNSASNDFVGIGFSVRY